MIEPLSFDEACRWLDQADFNSAATVEFVYGFVLPMLPNLTPDNLRALWDMAEESGGDYAGYVIHDLLADEWDRRRGFSPRDD